MIYLNNKQGSDYSLYEIIDDNDLLHPIINFNLLIEILDVIISKLLDSQTKNLLYHTFKNTCLEIFLKWNKETIFIAKSNNEKKISLYILTFSMRFSNITKVLVFTKLVYKKLLMELQKKNIINNIINISFFKSFSL